MRTWTTGRAIVERRSVPSWRRNSLGLDDPAYWQHLMELEREVIEAVRPDAVIAGMRPTATISARRCGVPLVGLAAVGTDPRIQRLPDDRPVVSR
jgi:hypothetical protein